MEARPTAAAAARRNPSVPLIATRKAAAKLWNDHAVITCIAVSETAQPRTTKLSPARDGAFWRRARSLSRATHMAGKGSRACSSTRRTLFFEAAARSRGSVRASCAGRPSPLWSATRHP